MDWKKEGRSAFWLAVLFLAVFLFLGAGKIFNHQLTHPSPTGMMAADAFTHNWVAQNVYDTQYIDRPPDYAFSSRAEAEKNAGGYKLFHPPVLPLLTASLAQLSGLNLYDVNIIFVFLFIVLMVALSYFILARFNETIALFSLPLALLFLQRKFFISLSWGWWDFITGELFLFAIILLLLAEKFPLRYLFTAVLITAAFMSHGVETIYATVFIVILLVFIFLLERKEFKGIFWEQLKAAAVALVIIVYPLNLFLNTWSKIGGSQILSMGYSEFMATHGSNYFIFFSEFAGFRILIIAGLLLAGYFFARKKSALLSYYLFVVFMSLTPYLYFTTGERSFQWRFLWPIYLSVALGAAVYAIYLLSKKVVPSAAAHFAKPAMFIILSGIFIWLVLPLPFQGAGLVDAKDYASYTWTQQNTGIYNKFLILYSPINDQISRLYLLERDMFISTAESWNAMQLGNSKLEILKDYNHAGFFCKDEACPFFGESQFTQELEKTKSAYFKNLSICQMDYIYLPLKSQQEIFNKNVQYLQYLVQNNITQIVFQNEAAVIGKNILKGEACESRFKQ